MCVNNQMEIKFESRAENESFARVVVGAFFSQLNPTLEEVCDVKTAVSEAVTNSIIHGYDEGIHNIYIRCSIDGEEFKVEIEDKGCGIANIEQAMEPLFTTKENMDRAGMGFSFMEAFMDEIDVKSIKGEGTTVYMTKKVKKEGEEVEPWIKQSL